MAELHIIGQVVGATNFSQNDLFCMWSIKKGNHWVHVAGHESGQTQVDQKNEDGSFIWAHPLDLHYSTSSVVGWPKLFFQIWFQDLYGRNDFAGYGVINVPTQSGTFDLEVMCWRPLGSTMDQISEMFIGGYTQVKNESLIWSGENRKKLKTIGVGKVQVHINVLLRNFAKYQVATE